MYRLLVVFGLIAACSQHAEPQTDAVAEATAETEVVEAHAGEAASEAKTKRELPKLPEEGWGQYGESPEGEWAQALSETEPLALATLLAAPQDYVDQTLVVEGRVADVCQKAACWMVLEHEGETVRVLMKDHAFSVAVDGTGGVSQVYGTVRAVEIDPEFVEHLEGESTNVDAMPEKKAEGNMIYQLEAIGVRMARSAG